jgi:predicted metalloprotease with PDZ domain
MPRRAALLLVLLASAFAARAQEAAPRPALEFEVDATEPAGGTLRVAMTVTRNVEDEVRVAIPAWAPGAYRIVKYAKAVRNVTASGKDGRKLEVSSVDDQTWAVRTGRSATFTVGYEVAVEKTRMDKDHCFLAGPDTYFYLVGRKEIPCRVRFRLPEGWKVGTGLEPDGDGFKAADYDTFIDCPTELGRFDLLEFDEDGARYQLVVHSKGPYDGKRITEICRKVVKEQNKYFGGPPFSRYVFLYHFRDGVGGRGLEHLNSTDIALSYDAIRIAPALAASITSHEYFHLWNVKRIRPFELGPFDYARPVRSKALWWCEGVTSYFGDRALARAGIWTEAQYLDHLAGEVEALQNNPDRTVTSVEQASWSVWDRKDYPRVDYYNKGELLGLLLDLRLRTESGGAKTLDDVMRHLYDTYVVRPSREGKGAIGVGFPEDGILRALRAVSGTDWSEFAGKYVSGVEELPYAEVLGAAGLAAAIQVTRHPDLGVDLRGTVVQNVLPGGEAKKVGMQSGDRIAAINDVEVGRSNIREEIGKLKAGDDVRVKFLREGGTVEVTFKVTVRERTTCRIRRAESPTPDQKRILDAWLGRKAEY